MRRFIVFAEVKSSEHIEEFEDDASDEEIEGTCKESLDTLIGNGDTGWSELTEEEWQSYKKKNRIKG